MAKIELDKYYTPVDVANKCWGIVDDVIGLENISYVIEPSCGNGSFCHYERKPDLLIDIEPETDNAIKSDFLTYRIPYRESCLVIGNPPFGERLKLAQDFYNKSCMIADYIAFILPITQLNNTSSLYKFDLIYSEDLGEQMYSDRELHCCFNIYKRPDNQMCHTHSKAELKGVRIYRNDSSVYESITDYDVRMCCFGAGTCGKILTGTTKRYSGEFKIVIDDRHPQKDKIIELFNTINWNELTTNIATKRLKQYVILDELRRNGIQDMETINRGLF